MFGLWYFSLALDEVRKRFSLIDRIITFFTGKAVTNQQQPAIESGEPKSSKPAEEDASVKPEPVEPPKVTPELPPKPVEKPVVKPAPEVPAVKPVEPTKPKVEVPPPVEVKPAPKEQPKPAPVPKPVKPQEPTTNGQPKVTAEPAKPAPPTPAAVVPAKVSEDASLRSLVPAKSDVVELPSSNEDSFIIVEKQKPKPTTTTATTKTNVKNSTLDFLRAEGGSGAVAAPAVPRNKSDTMVDAAVMEKMEAGFAKLAASDSKSLLKKYLTKEVFDALKNKKTSFGSTLLDCVQSGFENPDSGVGIYAPDAESYSVFSDLFDPIIEDYHKGFKKTDKHPASNFGDVNSFANVDPTGEFVVSTRVRCGRSMEGYPFNPCLTEAQYKEMEQKVSTTLSGLEGELKGKFYPLTGMDKAVQQQLIDDHFLFKEGDRFLQAANACRFWPSGRGIYHNDNKTFLVWCNEEDHLRIISMQMGGDLGQVYRRLVTAVNDIEKRIPFSHHDRLGFLTFCPTNLGTTIRASVHIKVPKLAKDMAKLESIADKYNLQVRGTRGEHSEAEGGIYDISNKRRMGLTEYDAVKEMYDGISELIKIEKSL